MMTVDPSAAPAQTAREMLRHTLATLAYRGGKAVRGAPTEFANFRASGGTRTPLEILAHVGDLLEWALWLARGEHRWREEPLTDWDAAVERFFAGMDRLDAYLASDAPLEWGAERIFQGPIADALTHVGQICLLRRMAGDPVRGENYARAHIAAGRVGREQAPAVREFD